MMRKLLNVLVLTILCIVCVEPSMANKRLKKGHDVAAMIKDFNPAYIIYNNSGEVVSFKAMVEELVKSEVIFLGEYHNSSLIHWLELEIFDAVANHFDNKLSVGMEMMESDRQEIIDEYMAGLISQSRFYAECYLWPNYKMDYAPIVESAKQRGVKVIATNVPRRYAGVVASGGVDSLKLFPKSSQRYFDYALGRIDTITVVDKIYSTNSMSRTSTSPMMGRAMPQGGDSLSQAEQRQKQRARMLRLTKAQALKDAVMARNILNNLGLPVVHINGNYHSNSRAGIITFLLEAKPELKVGVVSTIYQDDISVFDEKSRGLADFYIVLPSNAHKTY